MLAGRTRELRLLQDILARVGEGSGHCVVVSGEAGIGKSRLLAEITQLARAEAFLVLEGRCYEQELSFSYTPLIDMFRSFFARQPVNEILAGLGPLSFEFSKLLPELRSGSAPLSPSVPSDPGEEKRRLFEAITQFLWHQAAGRPLLMIVEDLHWSDDLSLEFLLFFTRRIISYPILLLLSHRSEERHSRLTRLLAELDRERMAQELRLKRLTPLEVNLMLQALPGSPDPIPAEMLETIYDLAEGNPFFTEELFRSLVAADVSHPLGDRGTAPSRTISIPRTLQRVVQQRVSRLDRAAGELVKIAAVYGRQFDFAVLQQLTDFPEEEMLALLKSLIAAHLVVETSAEQFTFRHALTREALYTGLLSRERRALHGQVAVAIEQIHADSLESHLEALSYHFYQSAMWERVLEYAQRAAEREQALHAPRAVIEHCGRALEAAYHLSIRPPIHLYRMRALAQELLGEFELARADLESALRLSREEGNEEAEWQLLLDLGLLWASRDYRRTRTHYEEALHLARGRDDPSRRAHSLNRLGNWHTNAGDPLEGKRLHEEALAIFQALRDRRGLAETFDLLGLASMEQGDLVESGSYYRQAMQMFEELGDPRSLTSSLSIWAVRGTRFIADTSVTTPTTLAEALGESERALTLAREMGWRAGESYALGVLGLCLSAQGDYGRGLVLVQAAQDIAGEIEHRQWMVSSLCCLGWLYRDVGWPPAVEYLERALELASEIGSQIWIRLATGLLASSYIMEGQLDRAELLLDGALSAESSGRTLVERLCWRVRAELALARGQGEGALRIVDRLIASAPNRSGQSVIPELWRLRGEALMALRRWQEAERALQAAAATAAAEGRDSLRWPIHLALGRLYQEQSQRNLADEAFSLARGIIEEIADSIPDERIGTTFRQRTLARLPHARPASPRQKMKQAFDGLTARQCEVAALVAQGKTNRQIAEELVLSERTVEAHVANILSRLDFTSRAQVAAWAVKKGLAELPSSDPDLR